MKKAILIAIALSGVLLTGCNREADVASYNLSKDADEFRIMRRVTVFNTIADTPLFSVEGNCSVARETSALVLTCKQGADTYKKHIIGVSDNTTYVVEQTEYQPSDPYRLKFIFKPKQIFSLPNLEVK